jgi:hypothetical protein
MRTTKPLSPDEVGVDLPDFVIEGVNDAIRDKYRGGEFNIKQDELIKFIMKRAPEGITRQKLFEKKYLDFEEVYREVGWTIEYDKPGWNESYEANFTFKPKNRRK